MWVHGTLWYVKFTAQPSVFHFMFRKEWINLLTWTYARSLSMFTMFTLLNAWIFITFEELSDETIADKITWF